MSSLSFETLYEIEYLKITLTDLFAVRRQYKNDLKTTCGRNSSHMRICLRLTEQEIETTKAKIKELESNGDNENGC